MRFQPKIMTAAAATVFALAGCGQDTIGMNYLEKARNDVSVAEIVAGQNTVADLVDAAPCLYTDSREVTGGNSFTEQINGRPRPGFFMSITVSNPQNQITSNRSGCPDLDEYMIEITPRSPNFDILRYTREGRAWFMVAGQRYDTDHSDTYFRARITSYNRSDTSISGEFEAIARTDNNDPSTPDRMIAVFGSFDVGNE